MGVEGDWEVAQSIKHLTCKQEDPSSTLRTHIKTSGCGDIFL